MPHRSRRAGALAAFLLSSLFLQAGSAAPGCVPPVSTVTVASTGETYCGIQPALDAAAPGDTVLVGPGAYAGSLTITKPVRLCAAAVGATECGGGSATILGASAHAIEIRSPNVALEGLVVSNAQFAGVDASGSPVEPTLVLVDGDDALLRANSLLAPAAPLAPGESRMRSVGVRILPGSDRATLEANLIHVPASARGPDGTCRNAPCDAIGVYAPGSSTSLAILDNEIRVASGGCDGASGTLGACALDARTVGVEFGTSVGATVLRNRFVADPTGPEGRVGASEGFRGRFDGGRLEGNFFHGFARVGAIVLGHGISVEKNEFDGNADGLLVCTGTNQRVAGNAFIGQFVAFLVTLCTPSATPVLRDNVFRGNAATVGFRPSMVGSTLDARENSWGTATCAPIEASFSDEGSGNRVLYLPFRDPAGALRDRCPDADPDADGVPAVAESDMSDGYAVLIEPLGATASNPSGTHVPVRGGAFSFDVSVWSYPGSSLDGAPLALDPSRDFLFTLFDHESLRRSLGTGDAFWKDPDRVLWSSASHAGSVAAAGPNTLRVTVRAADLATIVETARLTGVGAWAYYDVDAPDLDDALAGTVDSASDFHSAARNAVRSYRAADAMKLASTPLFLSIAPEDVDDDGHPNHLEFLGSTSPEQGRDGIFDPRMTPIDRDGDGFSNSEEDRNNNGIVERNLGETDPDDGADHPRPTVSIEHSLAGRKGDPVTFRAVVDYAPPNAPPNARIESYAWTFGDGASASGAEVVHAFSDSGSYDVHLLVTESHGATGEATATVVVPNLPPTASFSFAPTSGLTTATTVAFDASASSDPDGAIAAYAWDFTQGTGAGRTASWRFTDDGTWRVCLTVVDDRGASAVSCAFLAVANVPPVAGFAVASADPRAAVPASTRAVRFTDTSTDSDGTIGRAEWTFGDGGESASRTALHTYSAPGTYTVTLRVWDDDDAGPVVASRDVVVRPLPAATFGWSPATPTDVEDVTFSASSPDAIASWAWTWGDGGSATGASAVHRFVDDGTYTVTLVATDTFGVRSEPVEGSIHVLNVGPDAAFTIAGTEHLTSSPVQFADASADVDGSIASRLWTFGDGATSTASAPAHEYASDPSQDFRDYTVSLDVVDDDGATASASPRVIRVLQDTDRDGVPDIRDFDDDGDGFDDELEASYETDPRSAASRPLDSDGDGVPDDSSPDGRYVGDVDDDDDGFTDAEELSAGSDPKRHASIPSDYDGDGVPNLPDRLLGIALRSPVPGDRDPCLPFRDAEECERAGGVRDSDGDGWSDPDEALLGTDPADPGSPGPHPARDDDGDGLADRAESELCGRPASATLFNSSGGALGACASPTDYARPEVLP